MKRRVGPFFILALLVSVPLAYLHYGGRPAQRTAPRSPAASTPFLIPFDPVVSVLARGESLELTPRQRAALGKLQSEWERETAPLEASLKRSSGTLRQALDEGNAATPAGRDMRALDAQSAEYRECSRAMADARRRYWGRVAKILSPGQLEDMMRGRVK